MVVNSEEGIVTGDPTGLWEQHPKNWRECKLWDLATYINGKAFKPTDFSPVGLPVIKITELKYGLSPSTNLYSGEYDEKYLLKRGDLLFAWSGNPETSLDAFRWIGVKALLNQHIFRVIPRDGIDKTYLYFLLKYLRPTFIRTARDKATSMGHVKVIDLQRLIAYIPPLPEQKAIASILGALDDKIELNRKMNDTIEAMTRAIFKSWFVDFDPIPGFGPHKEWQESPLGKIPKGWRVARVSEAFKINPSRQIKKGILYAHVDMASLPTASARITNITRKEFSGSGSKFKNGDVLFARITPCLENGKTALVDFLPENKYAWGSTEFIVFSPKEPLNLWFVYCTARDQEFRDHAIRAMSGTSGRQRVEIGCFDNYSIVVPPPEIVVQFGDVVKPWFVQMKINDEQSHTLAGIRDALLPKLLSGEIRVKDAEKFVEKTF